MPNSTSMGNRTTPTATVRLATDRDLRSLSDILATSFHREDGFYRWILPLIRLGIYEDLRHRVRGTNANYACLVAVGQASASEGGAAAELLGTAELSLRSYPVSLWKLQGLQYPYVSNLAVRAEARRQGVARQLLASCEGQARSWGFHDIYLHVLENNHPARSLYAQLGYRVRRIETTWGSMGFGQPRQLFLHKPLSRY